jgi:glutathione synthase/RimK-type ligase-like ATP-grasp enzyme
MQLSSDPIHDIGPLWPMMAVPCLGYAAIIRMAYAGENLSGLTRALVTRVQGPAGDPGALMDLATLLICQGGDLAVEGKIMQKNAIAVQKSYEIAHGTGLGLRILAFVAAGDFMVNTPIDFLLHGSDATLILHFVDAQTTDLADLPLHDVAFMAIGESSETLAVLARMGELLRDYPGRCFNAATDKVASLCRDGVAQMLTGEPSIFAPFTVRLDREDVVEALVSNEIAYPVVLRPVGSHAGAGMARVLGAGDLADWLRVTDTPEVFLAPFIDYRGADGLYAKQRVVLIQGRPFASHLAASQNWMVHYLNADMSEHASRRAAEADWMQDFDHDFAARHARAFAALYRMVGLDYFGMDCAELPDGRLLIFELDVAMIVHDMDDAAVFPYKKPVMHKLFAGFLGALEAAARRSPLAL